MTPILHNQYKSVITTTPADIRAAQELRHLCFTQGGGDVDHDEYDADYQHVLIYNGADELVCTFRFMHLCAGGDLDRTYSAAFYDLTPLQGERFPMIEIGRFCTHPDWTDPNILRFAWSVLTRYVDQNDIHLLFGCSSFQGTDVTAFRDTFALLKQRHLASASRSPRIKAADVHNFAQSPMPDDFDLKRATKSMPTLLRTYLAMGGRVSDHAVLDHKLNTTHVFTAVAIDKIPESRKRWLRAGVS